MNDEKFYIEYRGKRVYLYLHQMQQIVNGISAELIDNEYRTMLEVFIGNNNSEADKEQREQAERLAGHEEETMRKSDD